MSIHVRTVTGRSLVRSSMSAGDARGGAAGAAHRRGRDAGVRPPRRPVRCRWSSASVLSFVGSWRSASALSPELFVITPVVHRPARAADRRSRSSGAAAAPARRCSGCASSASTERPRRPARRSSAGSWRWSTSTSRSGALAHRHRHVLAALAASGGRGGGHRRDPGATDRASRRSPSRSTRRRATRPTSPSLDVGPLARRGLLADPRVPAAHRRAGPRHAARARGRRWRTSIRTTHPPHAAGTDRRRDVADLRRLRLPAAPGWPARRRGAGLAPLAPVVPPRRVRTRPDAAPN